MKGQNKISASLEMHPTLQVAWLQCEEVRRKLLTVLHRMEIADWLRRPTEVTWTIAEHVDHLIKSEIGTSKMARWLIRGDYSGANRPAGTEIFTVTLDIYPYGPLLAPHALEPTIGLPFGEAHDTLAVVHTRFYKELCAFRGLDPEILESPDPATGVWFTLGGWVQLQALHEAHHLRQIIELLKDRRGA